MPWLYPIERDHTRRIAGSHYWVTFVTSQLDGVARVARILAATRAMATRATIKSATKQRARIRNAFTADFGPILHIKIDIDWTDRTLAYFTATYPDLHFTS